MRLRYLYLRDYGVLKDVRVPFDREPLFRQSGELFRQGDLHFVVGLNGTGKSSLLRALYPGRRAAAKRDSSRQKDRQSIVERHRLVVSYASDHRVPSLLGEAESGMARAAPRTLCSSDGSHTPATGAHAARD